MRDGHEEFSVAWRADVYRITGRTTRRALCMLLFRHRSFRPIFSARLCAWARGWPRSLSLLALLARQGHRWAQQQAGMDLPAEAAIGPGLTIVHGWGLVVSPDARIGSNVTVFHGVTVGRKDRLGSAGERTVGGAPTIGDQVWIGPGALVIGPITVGAGARIGGGAVVARDIPPGALVIGNPGVVSPGDGRIDCPNPAPIDRLRRTTPR